MALKDFTQPNQHALGYPLSLFSFFFFLISTSISLCKWFERWGERCLNEWWFELTEAAGFWLGSDHEVASVPADDYVIEWLWFWRHNSSTSIHWLRHNHHTLSSSPALEKGSAGFREPLHWWDSTVDLPSLLSRPQGGAVGLFLMLVVKPYSEPCCWPRFKLCFTA